ncbi:MAG: MarR family transcriptional regulator [Syntrophales bacterium]|jgi:DNA-binding MarR family transcriptional regulator
MKPDYCIFFQLSKTNQLATRFLGQKVSELNITPIQALVLGFLNDEDQVTSSELGRRTDLDSATLTGILDRLETAQLIERKGNPDDRRSIKIHLTKRGKALADKAIRLIVEANREFLKMLTENEKGELRTLIRKIRNQASQV